MRGAVDEDGGEAGRQVLHDAQPVPRVDGTVHGDNVGGVGGQTSEHLVGPLGSGVHEVSVKTKNTI